MAATDAAEVARLTALLEGYVKHVPPSVTNGSWNVSVDFKAKVVAARKVLTKRGVRPTDLQQAINSLHLFW